jgi:hypothetical protein
MPARTLSPGFARGRAAHPQRLEPRRGAGDPRPLAAAFWQHPANDELRAAVANRRNSRRTLYYQHLLRLIYRLLFLMVIEERNLVYPRIDRTAPAAIRIYEHYYSVQRLRRLAEKRYLEDKRKHDLWLGLLATFKLFEADGPGASLALAPLAGDLFSPDAMGLLGRCTLGNDVLLTGLSAQRSASTATPPPTS